MNLFSTHSFDKTAKKTNCCIVVICSHKNISFAHTHKRVFLPMMIRNRTEFFVFFYCVSSQSPKNVHMLSKQNEYFTILQLDFGDWRKFLWWMLRLPVSRAWSSTKWPTVWQRNVLVCAETFMHSMVNSFAWGNSPHGSNKTETLCEKKTSRWRKLQLQNGLYGERILFIQERQSRTFRINACVILCYIMLLYHLTTRWIFRPQFSLCLRV